MEPDQTILARVLGWGVARGLSMVRGLTVLLREDGPGWWECSVVHPPAASLSGGVALSPEAAAEFLDRRLRALDLGLAEGRPPVRGSSRERSSPAHPRRLWSVEEDRAVLAHERGDPELAHMLGRSVPAIRVRRHHLRARRTP
jgi:hypothetical protein